MNRYWNRIGLALAGMLLVPGLLAAQGAAHAVSGHQEAKVVTSVSTEQLESILKSVEIDFKKSPLTSRKDGFFYSFARQKYKLGLFYYGGTELMFVSDLKAYPLELLNRWNRGPRLSRAVLHDNPKGDFTSLEATLDVSAGVTDDTIRHFLRRFEDELKKFDQFINRTEARDEEVYTSVSPERVERILKELKISYKKTAGKKEGNFVYGFSRNNYQFRLLDLQGHDLLLEATFTKASLEQVNQYNLNHKFIRAVSHQTNGGNDYSTLEANLDCTGGVSDSIVVYFIQTFLDEARQFDRFLSK